MLSAVSLAGMILLGLLSVPNRDLLKGADCGVCSDLLMMATFRECVLRQKRRAHKIKPGRYNMGLSLRKGEILPVHSAVSASYIDNA